MHCQWCLFKSTFCSHSSIYFTSFSLTIHYIINVIQFSFSFFHRLTHKKRGIKFHVILLPTDEVMFRAAFVWFNLISLKLTVHSVNEIQWVEPKKTSPTKKAINVRLNHGNRHKCNAKCEQIHAFSTWTPRHSFQFRRNAKTTINPAASVKFTENYSKIRFFRFVCGSKGFFFFKPNETDGMNKPHKITSNEFPFFSQKPSKLFNGLI